VKPTRSTKRTLTKRRSAAVALGLAPALAAGTVAPLSVVPQVPQNLAVGRLSVAPQLGHAAARDAPHSSQKRRPASFRVPQLAQVTIGG
jgi:hypothetical protein